MARTAAPKAPQAQSEASKKADGKSQKNPVAKPAPAQPAKAPEQPKAPKQTKRQKVAAEVSAKGYELVNHYYSQLWTVEDSDGKAWLYDSITGGFTDKAQWVQENRKVSQPRKAATEKR